MKPTRSDAMTHEKKQEHKSDKNDFHCSAQPAPPHFSTFLEGLISENMSAKQWLVAIDGSANSESAFHFAIDRMDKKVDTLHLIDVAEKIQTQVRSMVYPGK